MTTHTELQERVLVNKVRAIKSRAHQNYCFFQYVKELFAGTRESIDVYTNIQWLTNLNCQYLVKRHEVVQQDINLYPTSYRSTRNVKGKLKSIQLKARYKK